MRALGERTRQVLWCCSLGLVLSLASCGPLISDIAEEAVDPAVPVAVGESLAELAEEENQEYLNELLDLEGIEDASERIGRGIVVGMLSAFATLDAPQFEEVDFSSGIDGAVYSLVSAVEQEATPVVVGLAFAMTMAVVEAMAVGLREEIGPVVRELLVQEVGPGIQEMLDEEFNAAIGETARQLAFYATIGTAEGLRQIEADDPEEPSAIERLGGGVAGLADSLGWAFWLIVAILGAILLAVLVWVIRQVLQARDNEKNRGLRDETLEELIRLVESRRVES